MERNSGLPPKGDTPVNLTAPPQSLAERLTDDTFQAFRSGVLEVRENGEEIILTKNVWAVEELVFTTNITERSAVVRETIRSVDVDVLPMPLSNYT